MEITWKSRKIASTLHGKGCSSLFRWEKWENISNFGHFYFHSNHLKMYDQSSSSPSRCIGMASLVQDHIGSNLRFKNLPTKKRA